MGGNALKNINVSRMDLQEFNETKDKVLSAVNECQLEVAVPPFYFSKDSFGDVDVVVKIKTPQDQAMCIDYVKSVFKPRDFYKNSNVFSFDVDNHQVNLIFTPEKYFESSLNYLSYNVLFNLLGRLAHKLGLKLGHKGLQVIVKNGDYTLGEVTLTQDLAEIFAILDVDINKYEDGFNTKEEIFDFVMQSVYFDNSIFAFENLNHINRVRNKKRKVYSEFVEYMSDKPVKGLEVDKEHFVKKLLKNYPEAKIKIQKLWDKLEEQQKVSKIFNGHIVSEIKGVSGPELGEWMIHFKNKYNNQFWLDNKENVREIILNETK